MMYHLKSKAILFTTLSAIWFLPLSWAADGASSARAGQKKTVIQQKKNEIVIPPAKKMPSRHTTGVARVTAQPEKKGTPAVSQNQKSAPKQTTVKKTAVQKQPAVRQQPAVKKSNVQKPAPKAPEKNQKVTPLYPPATGMKTVVSDKRTYISLQDVAKYYNLTYGANQSGPILFSGNTQIYFTLKKRSGFIGKTPVVFNFPLLEKDKKYYVSEIDFQRVIDPALRTKLPRHKVKKIMLDPGHGGKDNGASKDYAVEKTINLQLALKLRKRLRSLGFEVLMTRSNDMTLSLQKRGELCEKYKPDLYISIHCNATESKDVNGIETWLLAPYLGQSAKESTVKTTNDKGNQFDAYNFRLAFEIQQAMLKQFPKRFDRGVKQSRFAVLRTATAPAVLLEVGFISHWGEGHFIATDKAQNQIVEAIISGLASYVDSIR